MKFPINQIIAVIVLLSACELQPGSAVLDKKRVEVSFNNDWFFAVDSLSTGLDSGWYSRSGMPDNPIGVTIPHTWNVMDNYQQHYGKGWYFKFFEIPENWRGQKVSLHFSAIYRDAMIWLNDTLILARTGVGYTPFELDISPYLTFDSTNFIAILADNHFSKFAIPYKDKFDWPADGGLIRNIRLIKKERPAIKYVYLQPEFKVQGKGILKIEIGIDKNKSSQLKKIDVWYRIADYDQPEKKIILEGNRQLEISDGKARFDLEMEYIESWHFNNPQLYKLTMAVGNQTVLTDHNTEIFGFRSVATSGQRLVFNGESVRLPGVEWMPGSNPKMGMAEDTSMMKKMLSLLKNTHAVITRFHWQQDAFVLDWCDKNGLLVQEEIPLWQGPFPGQINDSIINIIDTHVEEMIHAHRNHPSIISWGIGNELAGQNEDIKELLSYVYEKIRRLDSTRLINYVSNTFHQDPDNDASVLGDVIMWNDHTGLWYDLPDYEFGKEMLPDLLDEIIAPRINKPLIISEYGLCEPFFEGGDERRIELIKYHTGIYDARPFIAGTIYFSLNDYRTHMGEHGKGRSRQRIHGLTDVHGNKKRSYEVLSELFSPVKNLNGEMISENFHVTGINHDGLPAYTISDFSIILFNKSDSIVGQKLMPAAFPGNKFNVVFRDVEDEIHEIHIESSAGFTMAVKKIQ